MADTQKSRGSKAEKAENKPASNYVPRLKAQFEKDIRAKLTKDFGYTNPMQVPVITKVVLNMGIGEGVNDRKKVENASNDLSLIAGQKSVITRSRKSIATFKLRDGQAIGTKVTLRKARMYDFIDRLVNIALPRVRGLPRPEPEELRRAGQLFARPQGTHRVPGNRLRQGLGRVWGMDITICTTARTDDEARALLAAFQLPLPAVRAEPCRDAETSGDFDGEDQQVRSETVSGVALAEVVCRRVGRG